MAWCKLDMHCNAALSPARYFSRDVEILDKKISGLGACREYIFLLF